MSKEKDREILRGLADRVAKIASLPVQTEKRRLWAALNGLKPERPMVAIDQICWNELNVGGVLDCLCEAPECRDYEQYFRRTLYQWEHFPVDMVVEPFVRVPKAIHNSGFGIDIEEITLATVESNDVRSHHYENQFHTLEDAEKIKSPIITHDPSESARRLDFANWLFGDLIETRSEGLDMYFSIWDVIAMWMGVQDALYAIVDEPEMIHAMVKRMADGYMSALDQLEAGGLLCYGQSLIHCTGAYSDELPAPGFDPKKPRTKDIWVFGLAQMFATCSPAMFNEFEIEYSIPIFERFGLVYYGCCDPLDGKMNEVRRIPNLRKISMSPWTNQERGAQEIGSSYVFSRKPNPSFLAMESFDIDLIRNDLLQTKDICKQNGCPFELILKDISTIKNDPKRLDLWADAAMRVACV
jgi:hypothetical protein